MESLLVSKDALIKKLEAENAELTKSDSHKEGILKLMLIGLVLDELISKAKTLQGEKDKTLAANSELQLQLISLKEENKKLLEEYKSIKAVYEKSQEADAELKKSAEDAEAARSQLKLELAKAEGETQSLQIRLNAVEQEAALLRSSVEQLEKTGSEKAGQEAELRKMLEEKERALSEARRSADELKEQLEVAHKNVDLTAEEWKKKCEEKESELKEIQEKLAEAAVSAVQKNGESENTVKTLKERVLLLENENVNLAQLKSKLEQQLKDKEALCSNLKEELSTHKKGVNLSVSNDKYLLEPKEKAKINTIYGKYSEAIRMFEEYARKYQEEKMRSSSLEKQLHSVVSAVEAKAPLIEAQRTAYEQLSTAYSHKVQLYQQQQEELSRVRQELWMSQKLGGELRGDGGTLEGRVGELEAENGKLREEVREMGEKRERMKKWYEGEVKRLEECSKVVGEKLDVLAKSVSTSDKFYEQFKAHSAELRETVAKVSGKSIENAAALIPSEQHNTTLEPQPNIHTQDPIAPSTDKLLGEQIELWKERVKYYAGWVEELKKQLADTVEASKSHARLVKDAEQKKAEVEIVKAKEETKRIEMQLFQCKADLEIAQANETRYKEENDKLRNELESLNSTFSSINAKLIEIGLSQYRLVKEALDKRGAANSEPANREMRDEDAMMLRVSNQSLKAVNENLAAQLAESKAKVGELEDALRAVEEAAASQPAEVIIEVEISVKERVSKIVAAIDKFRKEQSAQPQENEDTQQLKSKVQEDEKEIHKLKEVIAKQQHDYSAIISYNEQVIEDLQAQFHSFNESATTHISQITENIKADKNREIDLLKLDNEKLRNEVGRLKQSKEVTMMRKKLDETAPEKQTREHISIKEQTKQNLEQKQQDVVNMEKQMKAQSELHEKNKQELEVAIKNLKEREASLQAKIAALEGLQGNPPVGKQQEEPDNKAKAISNENAKLKATVDSLRAEMKALREELAGAQQKRSAGTKLDAVRKEEAVNRQLEGLQEKENEIIAYKRKISELNDKIRIMAETIKKEDSKEANHKGILKKLIDIAKRGKQIIEMKNLMLEKLKGERQAEGVKAAKRPKPE